MEPLWKIKHDWWMEDFKFEIKQQEEMKMLLRKHPEDDMGKSFRCLLTTCETHFKDLKKKYKKIYGGNPPGLITIRKEIQKELGV